MLGACCMGGAQMITWMIRLWKVNDNLGPLQTLYGTTLCENLKMVIGILQQPITYNLGSSRVAQTKNTTGS